MKKEVWGVRSKAQTERRTQWGRYEKGAGTSRSRHKSLAFNEWEADGSNSGVNHWQLELRTERLRALLLGFKRQQGNGSLALPQAQVIKGSQDREISGA